MIGINVSHNIGIGDAIQFTSIPENYYRHCGMKLVDVAQHWVFDHNPFVLRGDHHKLTTVMDLWKMHCYDTPVSYNGRTVMLSNAESGSRHFAYPIVMNRPRLYKFEEFPFEKRETIVLHVKGRSHGQLPEHVVKHVLDKYGDKVKWIGLKEDWEYSVHQPPHQPTKTYWELAEFISKARMFIGPDSGPSWVAQCYPDVITKKVRMMPSVAALSDWVPLEWCRLGSHWDDRSAFIYNPGEDDAGFTWSYRRL